MHPTPPIENPAVRATFVIRDGTIELHETRMVDVVPLPTDDTAEEILGTTAYGAWAELRSGSGTCIHRRMNSALLRLGSIEVPSTADPNQLTRSPIAKPHGILIIIVPLTPDGNEIWLSASGAEEGRIPTEPTAGEVRLIGRYRVQPEANHDSE